MLENRIYEKMILQGTNTISSSRCSVLTRPLNDRLNRFRLVRDSSAIIAPAPHGQIISSPKVIQKCNKLPRNYTAK